MSWPSGAFTLCRHITFPTLSQMHRHLRSADQGHMLSCSRSHVFILKCQEYFKSTGEEDTGFRGSSGSQQDSLHCSSIQEILKTTLWYWTRKRKLWHGRTLNQSTTTNYNSLMKTLIYKIETLPHILLSSWYINMVHIQLTLKIFRPDHAHTLLIHVVSLELP